MSTLTPSFAGSLDDIVFEGRNKAYGAFELRRLYQRHLSRALAITVALALLLLAAPLVAGYFAVPVAVGPVVHGKPNIVTDVKPLDFKPLKPAVQKPAEARVERTIMVKPHAEFATKVVPNDQARPTQDDNLPMTAGPKGPVTPGADDNPDGASTGKPGSKTTGPAIDTAAAPALPAVAAAPVLWAEKMPEFEGGADGLRKYLQKHLRYPSQAVNNQIEGKVYISFVVQTDGSVTDVAVVKGLGYGTEEAASKAVRGMPAWSPGMQNHHAVPVRFTLPITFKFE